MIIIVDGNIIPDQVFLRERPAKRFPFVIDRYIQNAEDPVLESLHFTGNIRPVSVFLFQRQPYTTRTQIRRIIVILPDHQDGIVFRCQ